MIQMKSRQLNYFLLEEDYYQINEYLKKGNIKISALPLLKQSLREIPYLTNRNESDWLDTILFSPNDEKSIKIDKIELLAGGFAYSIDTITNPIVEFGRSYYDVSDKQLRRSRIYFITHFYNDKDILQSKSEEFLNWTDKFLKWLRKYLIIIKEGRYKGFYTSREVLRLIEENSIQLID
jgi:hypothetical protein